MSAFVMTAVLAGALFHAAWNAIIKAGGDTFLDTFLLAGSAALVAAATLAFLPLPAAASWPYLVASATIQLGYYWLVAAAYRRGDLSYAYPIMRGAAPLLTALAAGYLVAEHLGAGAWSGILMISAGILLLCGNEWRLGRLPGPQTLFALVTAVVISIYTLIDATGARLSGNSFSYVGWMMVLDGATLSACLCVWHRAAAAARLRARWRVCVVAGLCAWASYAIALWAMTHAPIALVAALRETSVVFGTLLAALLLGEKFGPSRYAATILVCAGAAMMKFF